MYALRHCLCSYVINLDNDKEATEVKNAKQFFVCQYYKNWVAEKERICASTKTCSERERGATGLSIFFNHVANNYWKLGTNSCTFFEEVVSLSCDKFSLAVSISGSQESA